MRDFGLRPAKDRGRLSLAIRFVLVLTTHVTWIAATPDDVDTPERISSIWFPGVRDDRTAVSGEPASPRTKQAGSRYVSSSSRSRRQTEDGIEAEGQDDVIDRRLLGLVPISLQEEARRFPSPGGRRSFFFPGAKVFDEMQKRRWEGRQMVVWGKRGPERNRVAAGTDDKRGGKHKWATAGNMAVWG